MPRLVVILGPAAGKIVDFSDEATIGRGPDNTITLQDTAVSRHHALLRLRGDNITLYDRESGNGTWCKNTRVSKASLHNGDEFRIGRSLFRVLLRPGEMPHPLPVNEVALPEPPRHIESRPRAANAHKNRSHARRMVKWAAALPLLIGLPFVLFVYSSRHRGIPAADFTSITDFPRLHPPVTPDNKRPPISLERVQTVLRQGFVTAICPTKEAIWYADEERSLYKVPTHGKFRQASGKPELVQGSPDAYCYAIAQDRQGLLWFGTGKNGVAVYNGVDWRTLGPEQGLAGHHVYSLLATSDGSVWVGTEAGVSRIGPGGYLSTFREEDGLPSNEIADMVEDKSGTVWFAGYVGGVSRLVRGRSKADHIPLQALAAERLNDLYLDSKGWLWIVGQGGITVFDTVKNTCVGWLLPQDSAVGQREGVYKVLPDHHIMCVCERSETEIYVGTRHKGIWVLDLKTLQMIPTKAFGRDFVYRMTRDSDGNVLAGCAGGGLLTIPPPSAEAAPLRMAARARTFTDRPAQNRSDKADIQFPRALTAFSSTSPETLLGQALERVKMSPKPGEGRHGQAKGSIATYVGEDWRTQGDWIGRYGNFYYILCGSRPPFSLTGGKGCVNVSYAAYMGENRKKFRVNPAEIPPLFRQGHKIDEERMADDSLRCWIHWLHSDSPKVLQVPEKHGGGRIHSEWDDHAEAYPRSWVGPHLYFDIHISENVESHPGIYLLSLYFMNKDGHHGANRFRDYVITVKPMVGEYMINKPRGWEKEFDKLPTLATARLHDFRGGLYKRFLVREGQYTIKINKNRSFNTNLAGVFVDKVSGEGGHFPVGPDILAVLADPVKSLDEKERREL